jgi:hypothetical protein
LRKLVVVDSLFEGVSPNTDRALRRVRDAKIVLAALERDLSVAGGDQRRMEQHADEVVFAMNDVLKFIRKGVG